MDTKFSVVVITYNRPDYLILSLQSVLAQTKTPVEIIIVNDCSTVSYADVISTFIDDRIKYIKLQKNLGANGCRNIGVDTASGDVVAFLDDDDIWFPDFLELHAMKYSEGASAVVSGHRRLGTDIVKVRKEETVTETELKKGNPYCGMSGFSCSASLLKVTKFDEQLNNSQDWDIYIRIFKKCGTSFKVISKPLFDYRFATPGGITTKKKEASLEKMEIRLKAARKHKEWIGPFNYNQRINEFYLADISKRQNKFTYIKAAINNSSLSSTIVYFLMKFIKKVLH